MKPFLAEKVFRERLLESCFKDTPLKPGYGLFGGLHQLARLPCEILNIFGKRLQG